ncbi:MAG TPA: hypothetical protein VD837_13940 [Terriglobales bacterium]|nr:hypothetical protein [Terriglobales bacterium]
MFSSLPLFGQYRPGLEIFGGYSNLNAAASGWHVSTTLGLTRWFGVMADGSGYYASEQRRLPANVGSITISGNANAWLFGPQVSWRTARTTLSGHVLGGIVDVSAGLPGLNLARSERETTWAVGGKLDLNLTRLIGIRIIQADYIPSSFEGEKQHNGRVSAGVVFRVGKQLSTP